MRVPSRVLNAVVFLGYLEDPADLTSEKFGGTGFLVIAEHDGISFPYLVTADHVARKLNAYAKPLARLNDGQGRAYYFDIRLPIKYEIEGQQRTAETWYRHPTDTEADVAVTQFSPAWARGWREGASLPHLPLEMFVSGRDLDRRSGTVGIGDEVFIAGLFHRVIGMSGSNTPILRMGNVAMLPTEKINSGATYGDKTYGSMDAYLIEARSIGGLSGSPIFVRGTYTNPPTDGDYAPKPPTVASVADYRLLGLAHGHWDIKPGDINAPNPMADDRGVNMGIAIVTPAFKILETLNHPKLVWEREDVANNINRQRRQV